MRGDTTPTQQTPSLNQDPTTEITNDATDLVTARDIAPQGATGVTEDMGKYMGFENVLERYLSLPYDTVMNTNLSESFVHLGFLLLLFVPLLLLFKERTTLPVKLGLMGFLLLFLVVSAGSSFVQRNGIEASQAIQVLDNQMQQSRTDHQPLEQLGHLLRKPLLLAYQPVDRIFKAVSGEQDGVTYPVLVLLFFTFLILADQRLRDHALLTRAFIFLTLIYAFLWLILSSGIPWYGLLMLPLGLLFVVHGVVRDGQWRDRTQKIRVGLLVGFSAIWLLLFFPSRFCGFFPISEISATMPFSRSISQLQAGRIDISGVMNTNYPKFMETSAVINADPEALVYRIGTYLPFFIKENDQRVFSDVFLDFFVQLQARYPDRNTLLDVLRAYGFKYILVDVNTAGGDKTREQTLKKKYNSFLQFLYQNPRLELVATDRQVRLQSDGRLMNAYGVYVPHTVEFPGTFAAYKIN